MEFTSISIEITKTYGLAEWRDDIKKVMKNAGAKCKNYINIHMYVYIYIYIFFFTC